MKILVVVDMQTDFIDGALGTPEAQAIVPNVIEKINQYRADENGALVFTADTHFENYLETQEGKNLPVPHCIHATPGWFIPDTMYKPNDLLVPKYTFGAQTLPMYLASLERNRQENIESIEFVGLCTDICVISNVMLVKAHYPEVPLIVDSSCCAGVTPESHNNALEAMKMCQIEVV
jgi:nicotinamidase-related amidase